MKKIILILTLASLFSCGMREDTKNGNRMVLVGDNYYVYYDNQVIEIPKGTYLTKETKVDDYFFNFAGKHLKDERKLLVDLTKYFPHEIKEVQIGQKPENFVEVPRMNVNGKEMIDSIKLANILSGMDSDALINSDSSSEIIDVKNSNEVDPNVSLEGKKVEILNANGIKGFAKQLGDAFATNLKMEYNAENYSKASDMTYIINHKLTEAELNKFVNSISSKYIKILNDQSIKPDAVVVLITGNDANVQYPITLITKNANSDIQNILTDYQVILKQDSKVSDGVVIKYNKEDIFIAKKIANLLGEVKLQEDNNITKGLVIESSR